MRKKRIVGFTLIELVVVMVIIGILAVISVPMYRSYIRRAMIAEGRTLVGAIATSEKTWFAEHQYYLSYQKTASLARMDLDGDGIIGDIDIDARPNTYFTTFSITTGAPAIQGDGSGTFLIKTYGVGDATNVEVWYDSDAGGVANWVDSPPKVWVTGSAI